MKKTYLEISISASPSQQEFLIPTMTELGCNGYLQTDFELKCYIDKSLWSESKFELAQNELKKLLQSISSNSVILFREFEEENWNEEWEKTIQPLEIGRHIVIKPSWSEYQNNQGRLVIQIDPKMSFGTGYHETTRLSLQLIEKHITKGIRMLDMGTGTGILAIAAVMLGAGSALGLDNDEWSVENATENVIANKVSEKVIISSAPISSTKDTEFEMIAANMTLNTNCEFLPDFYRKLKPQGLLILSGLLLLDRDKMIEELGLHHFSLIEELRENEWIALTAKKT